jgi:hypothetical protein
MTAASLFCQASLFFFFTLTCFFDSVQSLYFVKHVVTCYHIGTRVVRNSGLGFDFLAGLAIAEPWLEGVVIVGHVVC